MPSKKPARTGTSADVTAPSEKAPSAQRATSAKSTWSACVIALGLLGVVAVGLLFAAREPSPSAEAQIASAPHEATTDGAVMPASVRKTSTSIGTASPAETPKQGTVSGAITVTGCLQRDGGGYRLRDTDGEDAPRSRSWKSGFIKKSSTPLEMIDAGNGARLSDHLGQRVSVNGTVISHEMHELSLRRLAATCE